MLKIWGRKTSSNVQALMWCVGELDLAYERIDVGHVHGGLETLEFGTLNPNRTIPVLRDGDGPTLWETGAILRYLAARYGSDTFWPRELFARTEVDRWAEWAKINIALQFTAPIFWRVVRTSENAQDWPAIYDALTHLEHALTIADSQLSQRVYLAGDHFSLADIQFGHCLFRYFDLELPHADLPNLRGYYDRLSQRAPFREHVMVSYDALRA